MTDIVTAASLQAEMSDKAAHLRAAVDAYREASAEYVRAEDDFKRAWAQAFLNAQGTEQARKSRADLDTADLSLAHTKALERKRFAKLDMESWQSILNAYQSVAATSREEMKLSR